MATQAVADIWEEGDIEAGQALFNANCASCHKVTNEVLAAPGLAGIADRWGATDELLIEWIQNPQGAAESGDKYIKSLVDRYVPTYGWMTAQAVSPDDIKNIMAYVQNPPDAAPVADSGSDCVTVDELPIVDSSDSSGIWFLMLLVLFLIIAMAAAGVNRSLTNASLEKDGDSLLEEGPYSTRIRNWTWDNRVAVTLDWFVLRGVRCRPGLPGPDAGGCCRRIQAQPAGRVHPQRSRVRERSGLQVLPPQCIRIQACGNPVDECLHELPQGGEEGTSLRRNGDREDLRCHRFRSGVWHLCRWWRQKRLHLAAGLLRRRAHSLEQGAQPCLTTCSSATNSTLWWVGCSAKTATVMLRRTPLVALPKWTTSTNWWTNTPA